MPERKPQNERLIVLLVIGVIALNYPLLSLFSKVQLLFGIPVLYLYIFTVWVVFIVCVALILEKPFSPPKSERSE
jgi:hypothetical protein